MLKAINGLGIDIAGMWTLHSKFDSSGHQHFSQLNVEGLNPPQLLLTTTFTINQQQKWSMVRFQPNPSKGGRTDAFRQMEEHKESTTQ